MTDGVSFDDPDTDPGAELGTDLAARSLVRRHRQEGCVPLSEVERVAERLDGGHPAEAALIESIEASGLDVRDDCSQAVPASPISA